MTSSPSNFSLERFELRTSQRQLLADGQPLNLGARAFDLLQVLIEKHERVVSRDR